MLGDGGFRRELENAARRRAGRLSRRCGAQAARARAPVRALPEAPPCRIDRARRWRSATSARRWAQALEQHAVFEALHEHALRDRRGLVLARLAGGVARSGHSPRSPRSRASIASASTSSPTCSGWPISSSRPRRGAPAPPACRSASTRTSRSGSSPAGAMAWANPGVDAERRQRRRAARLVQSARAELGPGAAFPGRPARGRVRGCSSATLRPNMRHAGALRIDHVMGLQRLFWIPAGASPADGAYVRYPFDDLARVLALEVGAPRCMVIGEDLGTVPRGFRPAMRRAGMLSCRVLYFERARGRRVCPARGLSAPGAGLGVDPRPADACGASGPRAMSDGASCSALPRRGRAARTPAPSARATGVLLLHALRRAGLLPAGVDPERPPAELSEELALAVHRYLAATPRQLVMVQLEDVLGEVEQANLPGTLEASQLAPQARRAAWRSLPTCRCVGADCRARWRPPDAASGSSHGAADRAARDLPPAVPQGLRLRRCAPDRAVPGRARHEPPLLLAADVARPGSTHGYDIIDSTRSTPSSATRRRSRR